MSLEIRTLRGPLGDEELGWVAGLYGPVDPKYASLEYVRHQFVGNPFGWSVHAFAVAEEGPVAHCAAVPFRARRDGEPLVAGKIEAVVVAEAHRGRRLGGDRSLIVELLRAMYACAHEHGMAILFGLAPPRVARIHERAGCRRVTLDATTYVLVTDPRAVGRDRPRSRRAAVTALSVGQNALLGLAYGAARLVAGPPARSRLAAPDPADAGLAAAAPAPGAWTVSGDDAWEWYVGSGVLQALEIGGRLGSRAIVRVGGAEGAAVQVAAWRPRRPGLLPALLLLGALRRIARRRSAATLRFQPWHGAGGDGALARACRLLGFAPRRDAEIVLHADDPALDPASLELTPFFHVTF